ncbi:MAG: TIGR03960 family B12-binding radical SAM protein [Planctomycetota bacterium]
MAERVEKEFLPFVRRPGRYIGGEINQIKKELSECELRAALCFPDVYEVGMSHTGTAIIYDVLNSMDGVAAERVFTPWLDAEEVLRKKNIPLFSLESKAALKDFDVIGFSITNELCYTNVLNMLDLAGVKVRSSERSEDEPLVIAGGGQAMCCESLSAFIDMFLLGDGEEAMVALAEFIINAKKRGLGKKELLEQAAKKFEWIYVPSLYTFEYEDGRIKSLEANIQDLQVERKNAVVRDFENAPVPSKPIVPFVQAVHERVSIEIMRGCPGRCRFCQASFCKRPIRYRSVEKILELAKACQASTGFDTISLLSLSTAEYPKLEELVNELNSYFKDKYVGLSLPSLRVDHQLKLLPVLVKSVRKSGITIAVEAASERLREIINKPLKDKDLFAAVEQVYRAGWKRLKLYFMIGFPGESEEDITNIVKLCFELGNLRRQVDGQCGQLNITVSWLVPKPHTPFGWLGQKPKTYFEKAKKLILDEKRKLRAKFLQFKFHDIGRSVLETTIGRGDRRLCDIIEEAWRSGAKFDLWDECFDYGVWAKAFEKHGLDMEAEAQRQFNEGDILPWEHLGGPDKASLFKHFKDAMDKVES